jgi:hypothetical protein
MVGYIDTDPLDNPSTFSNEDIVRQAISQKGATAFNIVSPATFSYAQRADQQLYYTGVDRQNERFTRAGDLYLIQVTKATGVSGDPIQSAFDAGSLYLDWDVTFDVPQIDPPSAVGGLKPAYAAVEPDDIVWPSAAGEEVEIPAADLTWYDENGNAIPFANILGQEFTIVPEILNPTVDLVTLASTADINSLAVTWRAEDPDLNTASQNRQLAEALVLQNAGVPTIVEVREFGHLYYSNGIWTPLKWVITNLLKFKINFSAAASWRRGAFGAGLRFELAPVANSARVADLNTPSRKLAAPCAPTRKVVEPAPARRRFGPR